jgi:hypothetical protein
LRPWPNILCSESRSIPRRCWRCTLPTRSCNNNNVASLSRCGVIPHCRSVSWSFQCVIQFPWKDATNLSVSVGSTGLLDWARYSAQRRQLKNRANCRQIQQWYREINLSICYRTLNSYSCRYSSPHALAPYRLISVNSDVTKANFLNVGCWPRPCENAKI